jgi:hypothetical protein
VWYGPADSAAPNEPSLVAFKPKRFVRWIAVAFVFFFSVDINMASCECESEEFLVLTALLEDAENIR